MRNHKTRRDFLKTAGAAAVAVGASGIFAPPILKAQRGILRGLVDLRGQALQSRPGHVAIVNNHRIDGNMAKAEQPEDIIQRVRSPANRVCPGGGGHPRGGARAQFAWLTCRGRRSRRAA